MIYNYPQSYHMMLQGRHCFEWGYELIQSQRMTAHCIAYRDAARIRLSLVNTHGSLTSRMDVTTFNLHLRELAVMVEGYPRHRLGRWRHYQQWC